MTVVEVLSSIVLTFSSTEYLYGSKQRSLRGVVLVVLVHLAENAVRLHFALHLPTIPMRLLPIKVVLVALVFLIALWFDCRRFQHILFREFLVEMGKQCLYLAPLFPWLATFISFLFMIMISIFDVFGIPTRVLNGPIYYGTLYGPFVVVYHRVKKWAKTATLLPSSMSCSRSQVANAAKDRPANWLDRYIR